MGKPMDVYAKLLPTETLVQVHEVLKEGNPDQVKNYEDLNFADLYDFFTVYRDYRMKKDQLGDMSWEEYARESVLCKNWHTALWNDGPYDHPALYIVPADVTDALWKVLHEQ